MAVFAVCAALSLAAREGAGAQEAGAYAAGDTASFAEAIAAVDGGGMGGVYTITLKGDFTGAPVVFDRGAAKTIILKGDGTPRTMTNNGEGVLFTVPKGVTFVLEDGVTLNGGNE
jgi:hypothetical protein